MSDYPSVLVDGKLNFNVPWSLCSVSCGNGTTQRELPCVGPFHGGRPCIGNRTQVKACNTFPCPSMVLLKSIGKSFQFNTYCSTWRTDSMVRMDTMS